MANINDWAMVRKALIDELEAINYYEDFLQKLENPEAIKLMRHINAEEKEHVAELTEMLRLLDPTQAEKLGEEIGNRLQGDLGSSLDGKTKAKL